MKLDNSPAKKNHAMQNSRLDLRPFFEGVDGYVILKLSETFPHYHDYSDVDVLCLDPQRFVEHVLAVGRRYTDQGFRVDVHRGNQSIHVDFYAPGASRLNFRFDVFGSLVYTRFQVCPDYAKAVLQSACQIDRHGVCVYVPDAAFDLSVRFLEYIEHHQTRPDKIKHLEYIKQHYHPDFPAIVRRYTDLGVDCAPSPELRPSAATKEGAERFYRLSETCQIPDLHTIYETYFGRRGDGCFVEVGAFDGEYVSNTSGLADKGWRGYYIEPVPDHAHRCRKRHSQNRNVTVSQLAIGAAPATVDISVAGPLSTISESAKQNFQSLKWAKDSFVRDQKVSVRQSTLNDYLQQEGLKPGFELLVVDVEGYEWEVFRTFDIDAWRPQMVIVELHDQNDDYLPLREDCKKLVRYFSDHRYTPVYKDASNTIYISSSCSVPAVRMDFFMIWGHGLPYTREIVEMLRCVDAFEIVSLVKKQVRDIAQFVRDVYACDSFPMEHLVAKTRYLLTTPPEVVFILVRNKNPQEQWKGEGAFRRRQCMLVKQVKEAIRDRFNPRAHGKRTEHHVVHASDFESQVEHLLKVLELPPLRYYTRRPHPDLDAPFHLDPFDTYQIADVRVDALRANIPGRGFVPVDQTPHFCYLTGDKEAYERYHQAHFGETLTEDHFSEAFDRMIADFRYDHTTSDGRRSIILASPQADGTYRILDGVHRAAILTHRGVQTAAIAVKGGRETTPVRAVSLPSKASCGGDRPVIAMRSLGTFGRFGNQLFQYMFLRLYALKYNLTIQTPAWIGQTLFGFTEPPVTGAYPLVQMPNRLVPCWLDPELRETMPLTDVDVKGYFQYHTRYYAEHKSVIRSLFRPVPAVEAAVRPGLERLRSRGKTLVGLHLRRGDFGRNHHFVAPAQWYKDWLKGFWETLDEPVLFLASDEPEAVAREFAEYHPVTAADLGVELPAAPFYPDFYMLSHCDAVATSNSTFSFLACMLNERSTIFMRPRLSCQKLIPFDPWNSPSNFKDEKVDPSVPTTPPVAASVPRVSVLMSVYNCRDYVRQAMESIYRQTYGDFEFVIVDDASTDGTSEILEALKDERTVIVRNATTVGLTRSLNIGLRHCRGVYVARMDADDLSLPERFAKQVEFLDGHPDIALVGSSYYRINGSGAVEKVIRVPTDDAQIRRWLEQKSPFGHGTVMIRREVLAGCGGYNEAFACSQDFELWLRLVETHKMANLAEPLYSWRSTPGNVTHARRSEQRSCHDRALREAQQRRAAVRQPAAQANVAQKSDALPLVSVIVPTYNRPESLKFAVASILNQRYQQIEIIIINDAGTDIADQVAQWNLRNNIVYLQHATNKGQGTARNTGLRAARGKYIAYLDDDDIFFPDHIERLVAALEQSSYRAAHTTAFRSHQVKQGNRCVEVKRTVPYNTAATHDKLLVQNCVPILCIMHEKACLEKAGYFDETLKTHEDWDLWIRISRYDAFLHIPQVTAMVTWRDDGTTTTSRISNGLRDVTLRMYETYHDWVKDKPHVAARQAERLEQLGGGRPQCSAAPAASRGLAVPAAPGVPAAGGKSLRIAIKTCTPSLDACLWGDMWFARGLAGALERAGHSCRVHCRDVWDQPDCEVDVAIHIKGKFNYTPKPDCVNLLWIISHPELHTLEEINRYDAVFCASKRYFDHIRPHVTIPCYYLPQAADAGIFRPLEHPPAKDIDLLFVGTNYNGEKRRRIINDVLAAGNRYNLCIVGKNWNGYVDQRYVKAHYVVPENMPALYARAKIVLNDHHETMRQWGFVNDRTYNLAAMKAFQISDAVDGLDDLGVVTYQSADDLHQKLAYYLAHDAERERLAELAHQRCKGFTFDQAAVELLAVSERLCISAAAAGRSGGSAPAGPVDDSAPCVSVVIACHNEAARLGDCLDSLLAQTLTDWELLVVDDGSTDGTREILEAYARQDSRIRLWFFDEQRGPYVRRNYAIAQSRAPFICIQDADDLMMPHKLATLYEHIRRDERLAIVGSWYRRFLDVMPGIDFGDCVKLPARHETILERFTRSIDICWHGSAIIRKSFFSVIGLYDEHPWSSDSFWLAKAGLYSSLTGQVQFTNVPECLTLRRHHADSQTGRISPQDPRSRRGRLYLYYAEHLKRIEQAYRDTPGCDAAGLLRACTIRDFIPTFGHLFEAWESAPVTKPMLEAVFSKAMQQMEQQAYVFALIHLELLERMDPSYCRTIADFGLLRAAALYAAGHDARAAREIERMPASLRERFPFDFSVTEAAARKAQAAAYCQSRGGDSAESQAPAVSVMMTAYNSADYIRGAIDSVLAQTFDAFELVIVDDGSTDSTVSIIQSYHDRRLRLIRQAHQGAGAANSRAVREARGEFVLVVDSDDRIEPHYLGQLVEYARTHPGYDYYYPEIYTLMDSAGRLTGQTWRYLDFENSQTLPSFLFVNGFLPIPHPASLKRRAMFERTGEYRPLERVIDFEFMTRNALAIRFKRMDGVAGYCYRVRPDSISRQMAPRNKITAAALEAMLSLYRPEELYPPLKTVAPESRKAVFSKFVFGVLDRHAKRHAGSGGDYYTAVAERLGQSCSAVGSEEDCCGAAAL